MSKIVHVIVSDKHGTVLDQFVVTEKDETANSLMEMGCEAESVETFQGKHEIGLRIANELRKVKE